MENAELTKGDENDKPSGSMLNEQAHDIRERINLVVQKTKSLPYRPWFWGESIAIRGLLESSFVTMNKEISQWSYDFMLSWINSNPNSLKAESHVAPGVAFLIAYEKTKDRCFLDAALRLYDLYNQCSIDQTGVPLHRSDSEEMKSFAWVDSMYYDAPFLSYLGRVTGNAATFNEAVSCFLAQYHVFRDSTTNLFDHWYDGDHSESNRIPWARGNGWALLGLVDLLEVLPPVHWGYPKLAQILRNHVQALLNHQDSDGLWHTLIDDPTSYLESSIASFFVAAVGKALRLGVLSKEQPNLQRGLEKAWEAIYPLVGRDGGCLLTSDVTYWNNDREHYRQIPFAVTPWGQGPWLLAATEILRTL